MFDDARYNELVEAASRSLNDYDLNKAERLLGLVETRRVVLGLEQSIREWEVRELFEETCRDYPVPEGRRRRDGSPGCGDPKCDVCYTIA